MKDRLWENGFRGKSLWIILAGITVFFFTVLISAFLVLQSPPSRTTDAVLTVKDGMSAGEIARELENQKAIRSIWLFQVLAKFSRLDHSLQAGEYVFPPGMSTREIVARLAAGETRYANLTIPEGYTVRQIAKLLQEQKLGNGERFLQLARLSGPAGGETVQFRAEGYLFPDTYRISPGMKEEDLIAKMQKEFDKRFGSLLKSGNASGLSPNQVIVLASLVEKEAQRPEEQAIIARVFLNRLQQNMPLQSCATIQYLLGYPKEELSLQDTQIPSPYNTYLNSGLPPGPIANPGLGALKAALNPAQTDYLYFVADKQGKHHFSRTYEEHLAAIEQVR
ncbi:endolytic transglycosylase MltG [Anaeroarcus burkinensis]|uniref:endolytic transglycosylase MltG n=1 Tax=Anaeroarcus burkinensis TaxID=82376 RepID=UPI0004177F94|nr:endolytic transglycosylase MltG [Anaeroarcus burkinensis]